MACNLKLETEFSFWLILSSVETSGTIAAVQNWELASPVVAGLGSGNELAAMPDIIEIKARCADHRPIAQILKEKNARFVGEDRQCDSYFNVNHGRLKLREGKIENNLIHYFRPDQSGPKHSIVLLYKSKVDSSLKEVLTAANGIWVEVIKSRKIFFIDNVKFHLDRVEGLGTFVEIEAIDEDGSRNLEELQAQCESYIQLFSLKKEDMVQHSYSDLLASKKED